jgi:diguanylate cyclase (GGDEF)-like protein
MLDIDHFKKINDAYGHQAGDFVLVELAKILSNNIRANDILARIGGEEFSIAAPNDSVLSAVVLAERLRNAVQVNYFHYKDKKIPVTISLGIATTDKEKYTDLDKLMNIADQRLYIAKWKGRNRLCVSGSERQNEQILNASKSRPSLDQAITMIKHANYESILEHLEYILTEMIPAFEMGNKIKTGSFDIEGLKQSIASLDINKIIELKKSSAR